MKNNKNTKMIFGIVGGVVVLGAIVLALVHFWDDIMKLLPCKKAAAEEDEEENDFEEFEDVEE